MSDSPIQNEIGFFWWEGAITPDGHYAPASAVAGTLNIDTDGLAKLDVHGMLEADKTQRLKDFFREEQALESRAIVGTLKISGEYVKLTELRAGRSSYSMGSAISHESYFASKCLISNFIPAMEKPFETVEMDLADINDWISLRGTSIENPDSSFVVKYPYIEPTVFQVINGSLTLKEEAQVRQFDRTTEIIERCSILYRASTLCTVGDLFKTFKHLIDILIALTGLSLPSPWPKFSGPKGNARLFYWRSTPVKKTISWNDCAIKFSQIKYDLGRIYDKWLSVQGNLATPISLYLSTKRGRPLFTEHQFVTLIWALEALHRKTHLETETPKKEDRLTRIIKGINDANDQEWMRKRFKNASEPALSQRLFVLFVELPLDLNSKTVRGFADKCAELRNHISHFGDLNRAKHELNIYNVIEVISLLLQACILQQIEVSPAVISNAYLHGHQSYRITRLLDEVDIKIGGNSLPPT